MCVEMCYYGKPQLMRFITEMSCEHDAACLETEVYRGYQHLLDMDTPSYEFLTEPGDALKCIICLKMACDPWQHNKCGRLLCEECLVKNGREKPCPNCKATQPQYFEDNKSQ